MTTGIILYILIALFVKHVVIDFPIYSDNTGHTEQSHLSTAWVLHIFIHGIATFFILYWLPIPLAFCILLATLDSVSHFLIDCLTICCEEKCRHDTNFRRAFNWVIEFDQYLHSVVYVSITFLLVVL